MPDMSQPKPLILSCRGHAPQIDETCWLAPNATVVGQVSLGPNSSCWFQSVIRGDVAPIKIGHRVNIQDGAIIHGTFEQSETVIEDDVSIGHQAVVHGAHIKCGALIGMGATVLNGAVIGKGSVIGANALIAEGKEIPPYSLVVGQPGKIIRTLTEEQSAQMLRGAAAYVKNWQRYAKDLELIE